MTKPYPFQKEGVRRIRELKGRALLADDLGLGKSYQSIRYAMLEEQSPIVVACPAFLKWNWEIEFMKHANIRALVLEGRKRVPKRPPFRKPQAVIVNYEIIGAWLPYLINLQPQLLILDEIQKIKNKDAKCRQYTATLAENVEHIIGLSATPIEIRPIEFWSFLNILLPHKYPSYYQFGHTYCAPRRMPWGTWDFRGATKDKIKELNKKLRKQCMIRRRTKDVLKELPPQMRIVVPMDAGDMREYHSAEKDFRTWIMHSGADAQKALRAQAITKMGALIRQAARMKLPAVKEWVNNFLETESKIILYAIHKAVIKELREEWGKKCVVIDGSTSSRKRRIYVDMFNNSPKTRIMIAQLQATSTGWNATACSTTAFVEMGWKTGELLQAEGRTRGIGRGIPGQVSKAYYFVAKGTIEEKKCKRMQNNQAVLDAVLDGGDPTQFDLFDQLLLEYQK